MLCVESLERTCGACASAREGDEEVDRPGTFDRRRLGGVMEVWMREEELISSASCVLGSRMTENLARLTVLSREEGRFFTKSISFVFSRSEMKEAMSSSSVRALPELPGVPSGSPSPS